MSAVERLTDLLFTSTIDPDRTSREVAQDLLDAGWHDGPPLTDAHQAVIDAAVVVARETIDSYGNLAADVTHDVGIAELIEAVRALNGGAS